MHMYIYIHINYVFNIIITLMHQKIHTNETNIKSSKFLLAYLVHYVILHINFTTKSCN